LEEGEYLTKLNGVEKKYVVNFFEPWGSGATWDHYPQYVTHYMKIIPPKDKT